MRHETHPATDTVAAPIPTFLTVNEVAKRLNVSRSTVYNLIASGRIPAHRLGRGQLRPRGYRVSATALTTFINATPAEVSA